jgi:hypothetical protein
VLLRVGVTRSQLTKLVYERNQGRTISMSAMKAGGSRDFSGEEDCDRFINGVMEAANPLRTERLGEEGQTAVGNALEQLPGAPRPVTSAAEVRAMLDTWRDLQQEWRDRPPLEACLTDYDQLLTGPPDESQDERLETPKELEVAP